MFMLEFLTPEKVITQNAELDEISVPAFAGELNILPGHSPLMTTLVPGAMSYKLKGQEAKKLSISWGYCQVGPTGVSVLAEIVTSPEEVQVEQARAKLKANEEGLLAESWDDREWEQKQMQIGKLRADLELASSR
jgi:F-type H+-transporting ATPase subunit epsilon